VYQPSFKKLAAAVDRWIEISNVLDERYRVEVKEKTAQMAEYSESNRRYWSNYYYQLNLTETYPLRRERDSLFNGLQFEWYVWENFIKYKVEYTHQRQTDWRLDVKNWPAWVMTTFDMWRKIEE
jgi:hypothetical protein